MKTQLKIGVVGAGVFGGYHSAKCAANSRIDFMGIYDPNISNARRVARKHNVQTFLHAKDLFDNVDAVIIACPAQYHGQMALQAINAGCHCLVEKPLAASFQEGRKIVELSKKKGVIVQVGHQERFVIQAIGLDRLPESPTYISTQRMSKYSERCTDVSVTLDLMTHDLDLLNMLINSPVKRIRGEARVVRTDCADMAYGILEFENGARAKLEASRVASDYSRTMQLIYPSGVVDIDFINKTLNHNTSFNLNENFGSDPKAIDSLAAATDAFVESILDNKPVVVPAEGGLKALKLALAFDREV